jgi:hypothetical protein
MSGLIVKETRRGEGVSIFCMEYVLGKRLVSLQEDESGRAKSQRRKKKRSTTYIQRTDIGFHDPSLLPSFFSVPLIILR